MELNWWEDGRNGGGCVGDGWNGVGGFSWDFWKKLTKDGQRGEEDERSKNVFLARRNVSGGGVLSVGDEHRVV
jgi:hypothetical protein